MTTLNIVELIEKNPITKLSSSYNNKLITKIKDCFTETQQQLFVSSFYCYLNCDQKNDFIIDLDDVWKWLEFSQKQRSKELLEKYFIIDKDYKILLNASVEQDNNYLLTLKSEQKKGVGKGGHDKSLLTLQGKQNNGIYKEDASLLLLQQKQKKGTGKGGHNKHKYMLTIKTFKSFCLKAGTKKADEIHDYYLKLEELIHEVSNEESDELKLQLQQTQSNLTQYKTELEQLEAKKNKEYAEKLIKEKALERQKILLQEFGTNGPLIYIIKVKSYENRQYIIKIGESRRGVQLRFNEHKSKYEECLLLDCFLVNKSKDFESFLHNHENIKYNKVTDLSEHINERELFLVGKNLSYHILLDIINNNIKYFEHHTDNEVEKLRQECEKLRLLNELSGKDNINSYIEEMVNNKNQNLLNKIENIENSNKEILNKLNSLENKSSTTTNFNQPLTTIGPRLQKINPDTLILIQVYESVSECMKENYQIKRPSLNKAIAENTIYHGYRWVFVDREFDSNSIQNIQPTKKTKIQNVGYIAKLNNDKTEILNVYLDRKTAAHENKYESLSALDNPVKNDTISNGYYYTLYEKCDDQLRYAFQKKYNNNNEIILYKNGIGQYDCNHSLIREFICKYDCIRSLHISDKTLAKALEKNIIYNNKFFKYLGSKLKEGVID